MELQTTQIKDLQAALSASQVAKKHHKNELDKLQKEYDWISDEYKDRHGAIETLKGQLEAQQQTNSLQKIELDHIRRQLDDLKKKIETMKEQQAETHAKDQTLEVNNKLLQKDVYQTQD